MVKKNTTNKNVIGDLYMDIHRLGKSALMVSKVGVGMAAVGRPGYINLGHHKDMRRTDVEAVKKQAFRLLDEAWERGVRYFDTARSYGRAEEFLGEWLEQKLISPNEVVVGSKWGYIYTGNWQADAEQHEVKDHSRDVLMRQWGETQYHLGRFLKLYQIHSATLSSSVIDDEAVLDGLWEIKRGGTDIGLTLSGLTQADVLKKALEVRDGDELLFTSVQITWNILEQSSTETILAAKEAGMGVIVKEVMANGRLSPRNANNPAFEEQYAILLEEATKYHVTVDSLALAYVLRQDWVDIALTGAATKRHLTSNLRALDMELTDETLARLNELIEDPIQYWEIRGRLEWN
jgi:aryl-alcohol dehydrogenase-like predicted oxidoreductase